MNDSFTRVTKDQAIKLYESAYEGIADRRAADWEHAVARFRKRLNKRWFKRFRRTWTKEEIIQYLKGEWSSPELRYLRCESAADRIKTLVMFTDTDEIFISAEDMEDLAS